MSYRIENKDIVIDGWEKGIADSPYQGISDMRGTNIISIPGESSVNFSTTLNTPTYDTSQYAITGTGTVSSSDAGADTCTFTIASSQTSRMYSYAAITFSASTIGGVSTNTIYWVERISTGVMKLYTDSILSTLVDITSNGTGTFQVFNVGTIKHSLYVKDTAVPNGRTWCLDDNGVCWLLNTTFNIWVHSGNITKPKSGYVKTSNGNGMFYYRSPIDNIGSYTTYAVGYLFIFRNSGIDYFNTYTGAWHYNWRIDTDGADDGWDMASGYLNSAYSINNSHAAIRGQGENIYWCDGSFVSSLVAVSPTTEFDPTIPATYTYTKQAVGIESNDIAQCLTMTGNQVLIGGQLNAVYVWDRLKFYYDYRIYLPETFVYKLLTLGSTVYIFPGNRGRIYQTNGSQASLYKKIPDHLSDTVEPYFTWGDVYSIKNQIYFGIKATTNGGTSIDNYGGVWAIDADTGALRMTQPLSYGTYANYVTCFIPSGTTTGLSLYVAWGTTTRYNLLQNGETNGYYLGGIDAPSGDPFTTYIPYIDTDMIPVGTYLQNKTLEQIEFKLTKPMVSGEGIKIQYRTHITDSWTDVFETLYSATSESNSNNMSGLGFVNFQNVQWIQLKVYLKSTSSSPSYTRLKEVRLR